MSKQYPGGLITKTPVTPSGPYETSTASGIWTLDQQAQYAKQGIWPTAGRLVPDPQFNYVTMLLHGDGTNGAQNNTFLDSSTNNFNITRNGNTTQGSFSPYGSNWSNYFGGTGNYLTTATSASAFSFGTGDFTIEFWINSTQTTRCDPIGQDNSFSSSGWWGLIANLSSSGQLQWFENANSRISATATNWNNGSWNHIAVTRSGNSIRMFVNGTQVGSTYTTSFTYGASSVGVIAGVLSDDKTTGPLTGYLSNFRIVKGTALYTGTFTPSTTPLTAVSGTSLLTCQSNRFVDNSSNAFALTLTGTPSVQRFNPFGASTAYSTSVIGGSGYFDGSGDYLTVADNAALDVDAGDFTLEAWVYLSDATVTSPVLAKGFGSAGGWMMWVQSTLRLRMYDAGGNSVTATSSASLTSNSWNHVAATRSGNTLTVWVNGVSSGTATFTGTSTNASVLEIGGYGSATAVSTGYISNARLVKGTAVYTSAFTPSTTPLTAISGTSLLTSMTNGAIFDNAMINDLETVGNAQISTSVVKYGTGSMYFDETGDYITVPPSSNMALGSGDFTIECWVRFAANPVGNGQGIYQLTNGYLNNTIRGPACGVENSTGAWTIYYGTTYTVSSTVPTTGVWYHTAFVRSSGTSKLYIDGTSIISVADTTNYTDTYFTIGGWYQTGFLLNGYIDDLRITKGYARYTSTFTPPTAAFPNIGPN